MTNMPEAKLAREAEICYATIAMVTDYDCWHPDHGAVTVQEVVATMQGNSAAARALLRAVLPALARRPESCPNGCDRALESAIMTSPVTRDPAVVKRLDAVARRVIG